MTCALYVCAGGGATTESGVGGDHGAHEGAAGGAVSSSAFFNSLMRAFDTCRPSGFGAVSDFGAAGGFVAAGGNVGSISTGFAGWFDALAETTLRLAAGIGVVLLRTALKVRTGLVAEFSRDALEESDLTLPEFMAPTFARSLESYLDAPLSSGRAMLAARCMPSSLSGLMLRSLAFLRTFSRCEPF